jgi:tripeptide aminopeptidase
MSKLDILKERFLRYAAISTQSDASAVTVPSTEGQTKLAHLLESELKALGLSDVFVDEHSIVYATLEANAKGPTLGFVSHLDTVNVSLSPVVKPQIIKYEGGDVVLNEELGIKIKFSEHPELELYEGEEIIFSDGTSVLGADNKAAMANIMTMLDILSHDPSIKHPKICVAFVPDEEIGLKGSKLMDLERFKVDFAYTIDSCSLGEIVYQTFNAGSGVLKIKGVSAHPMSSKGVLVNPLLVAHDYIEMFPRDETPECTDGLDGYWWFTGIKSDPLYCSLSMHIRDHDKANYLRRKEILMANVEKLKALHPRAEISLEFSDTYENIANNVSVEDKPISMLFEALDELDIKPVVYAMRGGTDGSALSARGIVTPNYFTGAHNFHSYAEFLPLSSFEKSLEVTLKLIELSTR